MKRRISRAAWSISPVVLAVSVVGLGEPAVGDGGPRTDGPPDAYEASNARIWGGIHFRTAVGDGVQIGTRVATWVLAHHFQRSHD